MRVLSKYWKILLALLLLAIAAFIFTNIYLPQQSLYEMQKTSLQAQTEMLQQRVIENARYSTVDLKKAEEGQEAIRKSRGSLYRKFARDLLEEDQLIYIVWLEENFGTEIEFEFGNAEPILYMNDGSVLGGVKLTVNFDADYGAYKKMIAKLAEDEHLTSVVSSVFETYQGRGGARRANGYLTILHYILAANDESLQYFEPGLLEPANGKGDLLN